ncbi:hypothetical protein [Cognatiyoonia sp. IB215182]|uniref:hypothetical protein n=1 Tax=Cognatiyoonia sp. IB215182 TaxID=3097353 RepID=UPI002A13E256|nr:hypothetical protein [Cognatiyoonia sp. IB215182]MDX8353666.1 hypothetical protein [Cognatiyoonia sp. IB215182]
MRSPTDFQYTSKTPSTDGLVRLARGWFDAAGKLIIPAAAPTRPGSPTTHQYRPPSIPRVRSPTDFQYRGNRQNVQPVPTVTTVETDGASGFFQELRDAARNTLLTGLDDALDYGRARLANGARGGPAAQPAHMVPDDGGIPVGLIVGAALVGGILYLKFG